MIPLLLLLASLSVLFFACSKPPPTGSANKPKEAIPNKAPLIPSTEVEKGSNMSIGSKEEKSKEAIQESKVEKVTLLEEKAEVEERENKEKAEKLKNDVKLDEFPSEAFGTLTSSMKSTSKSVGLPVLTMKKKNCKSNKTSPTSDAHFALSLLKESDVGKSVVISPLSISLALALVHAGAEGRTKEEIREALVGDATDEQLLNHYKSVSEDLLPVKTNSGRWGKKVVVNLANRMYIRDTIVEFVDKEYLDHILENFRAKAVALDFENASASCKVVNKFVRESTNGMISHLVDEGDFEASAALLINAISFEAQWSSNFVFKRAREADFYVKEGITKKVLLMRYFGVWKQYFETDEVQVLTLDYSNRMFKFVCILPKERFGLGPFRSNMTTESLQHLLENGKSTEVNIKLPKFKIEEAWDLQKVLISLGIEKMFREDNNELERIAPEFFVDKVKHKAFIEVDEKGTKAGAATVVVCHEGLAELPEKKIPPIDFFADHPFLFFITFGDSILFCGQYNG